MRHSVITGNFAFGVVFLSLAGCGGGFEAAKPDPEQIISITNARLGSPDNLAEPVPKELPTLPGEPPTPEPFVQPPADPAPVQPRGMGGAPPLSAFGTPEPIDVNASPYTALGRFTFLEGTISKYCSAELVGNTGDVLLTAAHCVYDQDTNQWNRDFRFALRYADGTSAGVFNWQCSAVFTGWPQKMYRKDYAFVKIRGTATGSLGLRTGLPVNSWTSVGYPSNYQSGQHAHRVSGTRGGLSNGIVRMDGNSFGGGSSGGAWLDGNFAIGLNSFRYNSIPNAMYGPLFDGQTTRLYEFVRRGCQNDVFPLGNDPVIASKANTKAVQIMTTNRMVSYGPTIEKRRSAKCPCQGSEEAFLQNDTLETYEADVAYAASTQKDGVPSVMSSDRMTLRAKARDTESIGCTIGAEAGGESCQVSMDYVIAQARRIQEVNVSGRLTTRSVTPEFCTDQCLNNLGGGYCLPLGSAAKPIIGPLAGFVTDSLDRSPQPNGVTTTKKELITAMKGDPNAEDPCNRSDFYRRQDDVSNDGIACITMTPPIVDLPGEARISLRNPPAGVARRITVGGATGSVAAFTNQRTAPALEFYGTNSDEINRRFGGYVVNLERRSGKLIITTEHGCSVGDTQ